MTIYFPNGNYGPICDIVSEPTPEPIITIVELEEPEITTNEVVQPSSLVLDRAARCRTVNVLQKYSPNGPYGPVCDIPSTGDGTGDVYYDCPDPDTEPPVELVVPKYPKPLTDIIGSPGSEGGVECFDLEDGTRICYDPNILDGCTASDYRDILDDMTILATRCGQFSKITNTNRPIPTLLFPTLLCGSIQRYSAQGVYEHTTPTEVNYMNVILIGAGGGAGGGDEQRNKANGNVTSSGRGNNSGGTGSAIRLTLTLDPSRQNKITAIVGQGGNSGLHYTKVPYSDVKSKNNSTNAPFNGGGLGGDPGPKGLSGGGGSGGGSSSLYVNGQLVAVVAGGGGGGGAGCNAFIDDPSKYIKNILCFATGGQGGKDNIPYGPPGRVHVGVGNRGGIGATDDPTSGKYGGGAGTRWDDGDYRNTATVATKGGGGGHGVDLDGNALTNGGSSSTANGASGGNYGGGGGGAAPGGSGGAGGSGAARIKYGNTTLTYTTAGTYTFIVPSGVTTLSEVVCISGGGSGNKDSSGDDHGGGGGGGSYAYDNDVSVTPGATLTIQVGSGGATRSTQGSNDGGHTYIISNNNNDGYDPAPWGNWQNPKIEGTPSTPIVKPHSSSTENYGLISDEFPKFTNPPTYPVRKFHPLWSSWMRKRAIWIHPEEETLQGKYRDIRLNLELDTAGTYTIKCEADDSVGIYYAPWYNIAQTNYIDGGRLYNGDPDNAVNLNPTTHYPATLPANISGASTWTKIGQSTGSFKDEIPTSFTFSISSAGRYVFRFVLYNEENGNEWKKNPAGLGFQIFKPNGTKIYDTDYTKGISGSDLRYGDGGGGGGGGGLLGRGGVTASDLYPQYVAACDFSDSTACAGSAGRTFILNHPGVQVTYFNQAASGWISGYQRPGTGDASFRNGHGGFGGSRPTKFSIIFNGIEYPLYNTAGSHYDVVIPGMGQGVWSDAISGTSFPYHYFWGETGSNPNNIADLQRLSRGTYEPASNNSINRTGFYKPKSLELALWFTPVKTGSSWSTTVRLRGIPRWGLGAGWAVNDTVTGIFPPSKSDGTQPWQDVTFGSDWATGLRSPYYYYDVKGTLDNQFFTFQIKVTEIDNNNSGIIVGFNGDDGHIRYRYGYQLTNTEVGTSDGTIAGTYPTPSIAADDVNDLTGT
jgi:hypothetical protein